GAYGRGRRQTLEADLVRVESGTYHGVTTGAPITLRLINNDAKLERLQEPTSPRGGHIDLAGSINYQTGIRQVLERASARETALRVAVGALAKLLLRELGIDVFGYVREIGGVVAPGWPEVAFDESARDASPVYTLEPSGEAARRPGSKVMDPIAYDPAHDESDRRMGFRRPTNNAGGIEGGTSNGEPIVVRASKKPISTLASRGPSIEMATKQPRPAAYERS